MAKGLSEEALHIAEKKREAKDNGEKVRYIRMKAESQIKARRDKKAFLGNQCKGIKENNRMGKTRDVLRKLENFMQDGHNKGQKWYRPNRSRKY